MKRLTKQWTASVCAGVIALSLSGCSKGLPPIIVGAKSSTAQSVIGEIVAQHLERRLGRKVQRRINLGGTLIAYQALQNGEIGLYPEYTGAIMTEILREPPSTDVSQAFERARIEMRRVAQSELFEPLGVEDRTVGVIRSDDPRANGIATLSAAAGVKDGWKVAVTYDFQQRADGIPGLSQYKLPLAAPVRAVDSGAIFRTIQDKQASMIIASATDGPLASPAWKILEDDQNRFTPQQACLLVKQSVLEAEPKLRAALVELSGKFTNDALRKMDFQVEVEHRDLATVAAEFLAQAGLK